jgi:hypothetical protein
MRPFATLPAVLALFAAACSDQPAPLSSPPEPPPEGFQAELACTASVREGRVSCADGAPGGGSGAFSRLIIGGQNVYVRLASSGAAYNTADSIFQVNVTVQNLMTQAFGTPDGTTDTGLRVFFHTGPDVTRGTGSVSVDNEDGSDTFLNAMTPYFAYDGRLRTNEVSDAKTWRFKIGPQVETFNFTVLVQGQLPHPGSLLLFDTVYEPTPYDPWGIQDIWGPSTSDLFAVGKAGLMLRYAGGAWVRDEALTYQRLFDVWGSSASDVYAVGDSGSIIHWNGAEWSKVSTDHLCVEYYDYWNGWVYRCPDFHGVWGTGPDDVWVVGETAGEWDEDGDNYYPSSLIVHYDGQAWVPNRYVRGIVEGVWGSAPNDVWAVGWSQIWHYDGRGWTSLNVGWPLPHFDGVWGLSSKNVYAYHAGGVVHYDGVEWRPMPGLPYSGNSEVRYSGVWGTAPDNLFVASPYNLKGFKHWDGSTWMDIARDNIVLALWGFGPNDLIAISDGRVARGRR